jgi:hypothetical protein
MDAFLEVKDGYVDSGAAPGKDTHWHDIAQLKPQTTTKEAVAAAHKRHKHFLFVPLPGTTYTKGSKPNVDTSKLGEPKRAADKAAAENAEPPETPAAGATPTAPAAPAAAPAAPAAPATPAAPAKP